MDLREYKIKNTTKCECGHEFTIHDMKKLQRISDKDFYGGIVKHIDEIKCPECQRETLLFLKQTGQTYIVKDIAQKDIYDSAVNNKIVKEETFESKQSIETSNENICNVCNRSFKSKSGLTMHMKTHQNN